MKVLRTFVLSILAVLSAGFLRASSPADSPIGYFASRISISRWDTLRETMRSDSVTAGTSRQSVLKLLGDPAQELDRDVYLYTNCRPDQSEPVERGCTTLIVTFAGEKVTELKFVNPAASTVIAADLRSRQDGRSLGPNSAPPRGFAHPAN
jgi:hypothetical protein